MNINKTNIIGSYFSIVKIIYENGCIGKIPFASSRYFTLDILTDTVEIRTFTLSTKVHNILASSY